jgi:hypothetical protein
MVSKRLVAGHWKGIFRLATLFLLLLPWGARAQPAPCGLRISLLTSGPGPDLYAIWGHSALRVVDSAHYTDYVFNYGTFDFSTKSFYVKFARGTLLYALSYEPFEDFREEDRLDHRQLSEQVLNLGCADKIRIYQFLIGNYMPDRRYYLYNFLFDNCSTRIRDVLENTLGSRLQMGTSLAPYGYTYRQAFNHYLDPEPWTKMGINILLGLPTDSVASPQGIQFLPDFLEKAVSEARVDGHPLDTSVRLLLPSGYDPEAKSFAITPFVTFLVLFLFIAIASFLPVHFSVRFQQWIDTILFFSTGLAGCLMLFLWFGTEHRQCAWNLNLLWALPTHAVFAFAVAKKSGWVRAYAGFTAALGILLLISWYWLPQPLPVTVIPITASLVIRSLKIRIQHM